MNTLPNISTSSAQPINGGAFKVANPFGGQSRMEVSNQWISRPSDQKFLSLSDLHAFTLSRWNASSEDRVDTKKIEFIAPDPVSKADLHKLSIGLPQGVLVDPTHWSFGQLAQLAKAPPSYLRTLPSQIVADALSYGMRYNREIDQVKTFASASSLLAATGPDYGRIPDHEVVDAVRQIAGNGTGDMRWKVPGVMDWRTHIYDPNTPITEDTTTLFASDRDFFVFLVDDMNPIVIGKLPNGEDDIVFRGFYVTQSEVGNGSLKVACFYLRGVCCNRILWGVEGFEEVRLIHSKTAPTRFMEEIRPALNSFSNGSSAKLIEGVQKAKEAKLANDDEEAIAFLRARSFSKDRAKLVLEAVQREEDRPARTVWDFAQGITAVARNIPNTDTRLELETEARRLLDKVAA